MINFSISRKSKVDHFSVLRIPSATGRPPMVYHRNDPFQQPYQRHTTALALRISSQSDLLRTRCTRWFQLLIPIVSHFLKCFLGLGMCGQFCCTSCNCYDKVTDSFAEANWFLSFFFSYQRKFTDLIS